MHEVFNGIEDDFFNRLERLVVPASEYLVQPLETVELAVEVLGFGDAIAEEDERVVRFKLEFGGGELGIRNEADRERTLRIEVADHTMAEKQR